MSTIEVGDLTPRDIGRIVTITHEDAVIRGTLTDLRVDTDWVETTTFGSNDPLRTAIRSLLSITVGPWTSSNLPLDAAVEVNR